MTTPSLFVGTAGWMAMADAADPAHVRCSSERDSWLRQGGILVTTDYVADETLTLIRIRLGLTAASKWWEQVSSSARLRWEAIGTERAAAARTWFFGWPDKRFSFTDCSSFVVMKELGIESALTLDAHFEQAGFTRLPLPHT